MRQPARLSTLAALAALATLATSCAVHEAGPQCDDDSDNDGDGVVDCADSDCFLDAACLPCGDGTVDDNEACDDGNRSDGDGCSALCLLDDCGNGEVDVGEECDDGNTVAGDGCDFRCKVSFCGNNRFDGGEQCDDGNGLSGDGCSSTCQLESASSARCGNFQLDAGEQCDDGNTRDNDGCSHACRFEQCGDGVRQLFNGEQCDGEDGVPEGGRCIGCRLTFCGNDVVEPDRGEECDDGNDNTGDGCTGIDFSFENACKRERCGDGIFGANEQCDDGNLTNGDGCSATCRQEFLCGDGIVQYRLSGELCDDDEPTCVNCVPSRACSDVDGGGICYTVSVQQVFLGNITQAASATFSGVPRVFMSQSNNLPFHIDVVGGALANGNFTDFFTQMGAMRSVDIDGDGVSEILAGDAFGNVGALQFAGNIVTSLHFGEGLGAQLDRVTDVNAGSIGGGAEIDIVGVAHNRLLAVGLDGGGAVATTTLPSQATRVIAAPLVDRVGVVASGGTHLFGFHVDVGGVTLQDDGAVSLAASIADLALVDVDDDGVDDVVALTTAPDELVAFLLDGASGLPSEPVFVAAAPGAEHVAAADLDGDRKKDLVTSGNGKIVLHLFADAFNASPLALPAPEGSTRVDARDIDGDGDVDLFIAGGFQGVFGNRSDAVLFLRD